MAECVARPVSCVPERCLDLGLDLLSAFAQSELIGSATDQESAFRSVPQPRRGRDPSFKAFDVHRSANTSTAATMFTGIVETMGSQSSAQSLDVPSAG